jgi:hypothetical protein
MSQIPEQAGHASSARRGVSAARAILGGRRMASANGSAGRVAVVVATGAAWRRGWPSVGRRGGAAARPAAGLRRPGDMLAARRAVVGGAGLG